MESFQKENTVEGGRLCLYYLSGKLHWKRELGKPRHRRKDNKIMMMMIMMMTITTTTTTDN
jgi:hypothetical protein